MRVTIGDELSGEDEEVIRIEMNCRGIEKNNERHGRDEWFSTAHKYIVVGFTELTSANVQERVWGMRK